MVRLHVVGLTGYTVADGQGGPVDTVRLVIAAIGCRRCAVELVGPGPADVVEGTVVVTVAVLDGPDRDLLLGAGVCGGRLFVDERMAALPPPAAVDTAPAVPGGIGPASVARSET